MASPVDAGFERTAGEKGRDLEAEIEHFFAANGYETSRNLMLEGRSGGRHEIDVFAKKSDGITDFSVMIECKAWNQPIEKDIVSKVSYVVRDLGLNKGIIVSLEGWRIGAEKAGKELGIDLWDGHDLEKRLGQVLVSELRGAGRRDSDPLCGASKNGRQRSVVGGVEYRLGWRADAIDTGRASRRVGRADASICWSAVVGTGFSVSRRLG